jgi:UDP-N-acetylglucosamine 3-dehydrogenase
MRGSSVINLGIIGCGRITETVHLPVLRRLRGVRVYAACDARDDRLGLVQQAFGIPRLYRDWTELIEDRRVDAVLIATPGNSHRLLAAAALDNRRHVLVEKPFALTVADAEALVQKARDSSVVSMVGFNYRFHPLARQLKAIIERGAIGRPLAAFTTFMTSADQRTSITDYKRTPERGGGVFHDKAAHTLDLLRFVFDCEVARAQATARSEVHVQDFGMVELELANGVQVSGCFSDRAIPDCSFVIFGDEGKVGVNFTRPTGVWLYRKEFSRTRVTKLWNYVRQAPQSIASTVCLATARGRLSSYFSQWQHFFSCIEGHQQATPNFDDGLAVTRTVSQLIGSLAGSSGRSVEAPSVSCLWEQRRGAG